MSDIDDDTLRQRVRDIFGRDLPADRIAAFRPRLIGMLRNVELLDAWAGRLGRTEPAAVHATPRPAELGDD